MIRGAWTKLQAKLTTNMRQRVAAGLVLALLVLSIPRPAQAQFGIDLSVVSWVLHVATGAVIDAIIRFTGNA